MQLQHYKKDTIKMRTKRIKLYSFSELSEEAQTKVIDNFINDAIKFESEYYYNNWPNFKKAVDKAEKMQTPWFTGSYVYDYCKTEILEILNDGEEDYLISGSLPNCL